MFTWICPKCKSEVPPHLAECPNCAGKEAQPAVPAAPPPPPPTAQPPYQTPPPVYQQPPAPQTPPEQTYVIPPPAGGVPGWLIAILVAAGLVLLGAVGYFYLLPSSRPAGASKAAEAKADFPVVSKSQNPYAKHVEVTGFRVLEDKKNNVVVKAVVVNHSLAEIADLEIKLDLRASTSQPGDPPMCEVNLKVPSLGPQEIKDVSAMGKTQLRAYELPDWQFLRAEYDILSPKP